MCEAEKIPYIEDRTGSALGVEAAQSTASLTPVERPPQRAWSWLRGILVSLLSCPVDASVPLTQYVFLPARYKEQPACLMLASDDFDTAPPSKRHMAAAPAVVVPFSLGERARTGRDVVQRSCLRPGEPRQSRGGHAYPRWVYEHRGRKMVRLPARSCSRLNGGVLVHTTVAATARGGCPGGQRARSAKSLTPRGIPAEKLMVTGALADDVLADSRDAGRRTEPVPSLTSTRSRRFSAPCPMTGSR